MEPLLLHLENNVYLEGDRLVLVDRRRLPREIVRVSCPDHEAVARAIEDMVVQGAGDIAVTAGFGLYLAARETGRRGDRDYRAFLDKAAARLKATRPTGYHLAALLDRLMGMLAEDPNGPPPAEKILSCLQNVLERQRRISEDTGRHAETLLVSGEAILTHCFAGGALLYMLQTAREKGKEIQVLCTETRPYLQGARLTAWSISQLGIPVTLITDNMAAHCMSRGMVQKVFTAADRVALDGTVANKVGTLQLAICADRYRIPFWVLAYGGPDRRTARGEDIPIEERDPSEVLTFRGIPITGEDVKGYYPAFDLTPKDLVTGIVTSRGIETWKG
ncbi:MAG: eIF-2B alpha/beta/delta [Deltaproteobacteria bacterium HGW-Deltaproteobacteria-19]|jgi:methylthioribose-1-phosphate isomerase|nr:MAG: eIF-2B alpha/beta/delta [Deltaproteobacteria bacterium HGW-Deltaproteobacteria-19]